MNMKKWPGNLIDSLIYLFVGPFTVIGTVPMLLIGLDESMGLPRLTSESVSAVGWAIMNAGAALAVWCSWLMLRSHGSPVPSIPASELVRSGPYAVVRHPMMHSLLIVCAGEILVTGSLLILVWLPVAARAGELFVEAYEEPVLMARFGDSYRNYCEEVPRWLTGRLWKR